MSQTTFPSDTDVEFADESHEVDVVELDDEDSNDEAESHDGADSDGADSDETSPGSPRTGGRSTNRALVRRVAAKAAAVDEAREQTREVAAMLVGSSTGMVELTTAIMCADRGATQPINDLFLIAEEDAFAAATTAGGLGRDRMKAVWGLLAALNVGGLPASMPASNPKAALELARCVFRLDLDLVREDLDAVTALLRKS